MRNRRSVARNAAGGGVVDESLVDGRYRSLPPSCGCEEQHGYFCPTPRKGKIWQKLGCDARPSEDQNAGGGRFRCKNPSRQCRSCTLILATVFALLILRTRAI